AVRQHLHRGIPLPQRPHLPGEGVLQPPAVHAGPLLGSAHKGHFGPSRMTAPRSGYPGVVDGQRSPGDVTHPSDVTPTRGLFDRLAERVTRLVSGGPFSFICAAVVGGWIVLGA